MVKSKKHDTVKSNINVPYPKLQMYAALGFISVFLFIILQSNGRSIKRTLFNTPDPYLVRQNQATVVQNKEQNIPQYEPEKPKPITPSLGSYKITESELNKYLKESNQSLNEKGLGDITIDVGNKSIVMDITNQDNKTSIIFQATEDKRGLKAVYSNLPESNEVEQAFKEQMNDLLKNSLETSILQFVGGDKLQTIDILNNEIEITFIKNE